MLIVRMLILITILIQYSKSQAQLRFPNGNVLDLRTSNNFLYLETRILFNTGEYKSSDYNWVKLSDSLDPNWFVTACFNGECRTELSPNGSFLSDYGIDDTTCFIAFHVETYDFDGKSVIKYRVYNKNNISDQSDLIFNITFEDKSNIDMNEASTFRVMNPVRNEIIIESKDSLQEVLLYDNLGRLVSSWDNAVFENGRTRISLPPLNGGLFVLRVRMNGLWLSRKIQMSN
jgi:hypothetical protein